MRYTNRHFTYLLTYLLTSKISYGRYVHSLDTLQRSWPSPGRIFTIVLEKLLKIIMTTSVTRPRFTTQHQTCKTKTKTDHITDLKVGHNVLITVVTPSIALCRRPHRVGHYAAMAVVCLSVCLSVCSVPDPKSKTEGNLNINKKEAVTRDRI